MRERCQAQLRGQFRSEKGVGSWGVSQLEGSWGLWGPVEGCRIPGHISAGGILGALGPSTVGLIHPIMARYARPKIRGAGPEVVKYRAPPARSQSLMSNILQEFEAEFSVLISKSTCKT